MHYLIAAAIFIFITSFFITPHMIIASLSYFIMLVAMSVRSNSLKLHAALMICAVITDLTLVLLLQIERSAIQTALNFNLNFFQQMHIAVSAGATLLYLPIVTLGILKFTKFKSTNIRRYHKHLGIWAFTLRTLGYFLMFSMLTKN